MAAGFDAVVGFLGLPVGLGNVEVPGFDIDIESILGILEGFGVFISAPSTFDDCSSNHNTFHVRLHV